MLARLLTSSVAQAELLLWLQTEAWTGPSGYDVLMAVEGWVKIAGKLSSAISGLTLGGEMVIAEVALALTTVGNSIEIVRVV